jgi:hypothetical protein
MLYTAKRRRVPIPPLSDAEPHLDARRAYAIQEALVERLVADGATKIGWKLGLTSKLMRDMFGVDQPDYAPILDTVVLEDGVVVPLDTLIQPQVEAEIALVLGRGYEARCLRFRGGGIGDRSVRRHRGDRLSHCTRLEFVAYLGSVARCVRSMPSQAARNCLSLPTTSTKWPLEDRNP